MQPVARGRIHCWEGGSLWASSHRTCRMHLKERHNTQFESSSSRKRSKAAHFLRALVAPEQTGQSFCSYQLWMRLQRAIGAISRGAGATDAAYAAGFSDAAHLARTFRKMMGIAPSSVIPENHSERGSVPP